jgi:hypothetical protein
MSLKKHYFMLEKIVLYRAKFVAGIVGQIISMQAVFGSLVRLRTRELYTVH